MEGPVKCLERLISWIVCLCGFSSWFGIGRRVVGEGETTIDQTDIRGSKPHDLIRRAAFNLHSVGLYERALLG